MTDNDDNRRVLIGRQPILDRDQKLLAYELLFSSGNITGEESVEMAETVEAAAGAADKVDAPILQGAHHEVPSVDETLGDYRGFIKVDSDFLFSDLIEELPRHLVVLEIFENLEPTPEVFARCRQLRELGFTLAVDEYFETMPEYQPLLALVDIIKVNLSRFDDEQLASAVQRLKPFGKQLLAVDVDTREQMALCRMLGFDLFQGYFFTKPQFLDSKKLSPSQLALMRLLGQLMEDADTSVVEQTFKQEPGLSVNLLRLTNSAAGGLSSKVSSLRHAIAILGRRQLLRWIQLLLYTNSKDQGASNPLLQLAATRGRLMELLADRLHGKSRELSDQAFLAGILSLMPTLLGVPMEEILTQLPVARRVTQALSDYSGPLGELLLLVETTEQTDPLVAEALLQKLPTLHALNAQFIGNCIAQAMAWANDLGQEIGE